MSVLLNINTEKIKTEAQAELQNMPFPTKKNEDWKYTRISAFKPEKYAPAEVHQVSKEVVDYHLIKDLNSYKIVFIDGVFSAEFSRFPENELTVIPFSKIEKDEKLASILAEKLNSLADKNRYFTELNTASFQDGTFIYIPENECIEKPIELLYLNTVQGRESVQNIRNLFVAGKNSQVSITVQIRTLSDLDFLTNMVTEIFVGENAHFRLYKIQDDTRSAHLIDSVFVEQQADSKAFVHTFSFGGKTTRNELSFDHKGENINSTLKGISIIGDSQEVGNHTLVQHNQPNCESHELYRGIFNGAAHGIFNGQIKVHEIAQKTNAFQQNNNVLLSDEAVIDTKPQLEIFADDVKCSHGCTVGQLDDDALFYMKQRGIHEKEAKALLMFAFCSDVMETVTLPELKNKINRVIAQKLGVEIDFEF
ncbi:MAG: Fe-S cluster assembly protein SufD [Flavobacteriaceae bacterium]|jgi:Fe-S cluster assembly protein SufD|nr:Fe-S cluster assembly protein SufD [Flavobacteriaceae bacterium]